MAWKNRNWNQFQTIKIRKKKLNRNTKNNYI